MHIAPPPTTRDLLPPLLACLPLAFVSPRPPPALLPLLAPVLRQRVSFLSTSGSARNDGWLPLLSWDRSSQLAAAVERMQLEPHPVSGEIELDDTPPAQYRRLDDETLHARLQVEQFDLQPTYVWCESDEHGGTGPGWKLTDLRSLEDAEDEAQWYDTPSAANDAANTFIHHPTTANGSGSRQPVFSTTTAMDEDGEDNDDYWASYDRTPGRTPALKHSPAPLATSTFQQSNRERSQSELEYFSRYGSEVQPAMDGHDPDEEDPSLGESTLNGDALVRQQAQQHQQQHHLSQHDDHSHLPLPPSYSHAKHLPDSAVATALDQSIHSDLSMPRPISPTSSHSSSVERLEERAAAMSSERGADRAQLGIKQHISTDIKSLFRLAKSVGMDRAEFERIVRTELDVLSLLEQDE